MKLISKLIFKFICWTGIHKPKVTKLLASQTHWPFKTYCIHCKRGLIIHPSGRIEESEKLGI